MIIGLGLVVVFLSIALLADAVITLRKAQRSCEKLVAVCEETIRSIKDKGL